MRSRSVPLGTQVVDRLDVDAVVGEEYIARLFAAFGIADKERNDVGPAQHHRQPRRG